MTRDRIVSLRLSADEHQLLSDLAETIGIPLSELVRRGALALTYPPSTATFGGTASAPLVRVLTMGGHE